MKRDLDEIADICKRVKGKLENFKDDFNDINEVKILKNNIYDKASKVFVYNLKRLIQLEATQKNLARKIGVSEDLLSKYKSGEAFPSIETLIYICEAYNIKIDKFLNEPLSASDLENLENNREAQYNIFESEYYVYFLVTNINREGAIHEGVFEINNDDVDFKILYKGDVVKCFRGSYKIMDRLISFNLHSSSEGTAYINMIKPNLNKNKYVGGVAMMMLPSDANSKPCVQKILFSKVRLDRDLYYNDLKELLNFNVEGTGIGHFKINQADDEMSYNFIQKLV